MQAYTTFMNTWTSISSAEPEVGRRIRDLLSRAGSCSSHSRCPALSAESTVVASLQCLLNVEVLVPRFDRWAVAVTDIDV